MTAFAQNLRLLMVGLPTTIGPFAKSGDFYLLQSFYEDTRDRNALFFNTRIVRVTEALMFAGKLYTTLGAHP